MFQNLYSIVSESVSEGSFSYGIKLDAGHQIYQVHFPGTPITPGACQMEIIRQLAERSMGCGVTFTEVKNIKFLQIIGPADHSDITVEGSMSEAGCEGLIKCNAVIRSGDTVFTKTSFIIKTGK